MKKITFKQFYKKANIKDPTEAALLYEIFKKSKLSLEEFLGKKKE